MAVKNFSPLSHSLERPASPYLTIGNVEHFFSLAAFQLAPRYDLKWAIVDAR